jgi:tetrahydromethanopterin S-methyltransferase subunit G
MALSNKSTDGFVAKSLDTLPRSVTVIFGILFALTIFLVATGFNGAFVRVINSYAARLERSVESLEAIAGRIAATEAGLTAVSTRVDTLDKRLAAVESAVDQHINKTPK